MKEILGAFKKLLDARALWIFIFLLKALFALAFILPFYLLTDSLLSSSVYSRRILADWDISVLIELFSGRMELIPTFLLFGFIAGLVFLIIMQFLNGGIYYLAISGKIKSIRWSEFFAECVSNFKAHMMVTGMMMIIYLVIAIAGLFFVNIIGLAGGKLVGNAAMTMAAAKAMLLLLIFLTTSIFSDSARAAITTKPGQSFRENLKNAADFFRPNMIRLIRCYLITYTSFLCVWLITEWLGLRSVEMLGSIVGILLEFILFQICSFVRSGQKLWYLFIFGVRFRAVNPGRFLPEQAELDL